MTSRLLGVKDLVTTMTSLSMVKRDEGVKNIQNCVTSFMDDCMLLPLIPIEV